MDKFKMSSTDGDLKQRLIASVKKEVKQLMEEAVTKKYIHEESSSITQLCASVEACLSQGLKRRALGLFKTSSTTALLHKIAKSCAEAEHISNMVNVIESNDANKTSSSSDSFNRANIIKRANSSSVTSMNQSSATIALISMKYLWIRLALFEKKLVKIIEYLVLHASTYYDRDALVADADYGSILGSLLVGPCALEFTRAKTANHYWTDPHADELVQRHRISTGRRSSSTTSRPPIVNFKRTFNASADDSNSCNLKPIATTTVAKDYVESLHQNSKATLLYGKNNVHVLPKAGTSETMAGYLSLHQNVQNLTVKWTPNQLMNSYNEADEDEELDKDVYWAYALNINIDDIVYVHCHQSRGDDSGGTIILVGHDGVQRPPIHFPEGGHMQQFLSCLETGLLPHGQLDPPLWSQRGIGKLFPKGMRRRILPSVMESFDETPIDYVFRIVSKSRHEEFAATYSILDFVRSTPRRKQLSSCSTTGSSDCSSKSVSIDHYPLEQALVQTVQNTSIEKVCSTMRQQIISRAFYGWLAYCRHLSTVRTHLSGLVHDRITPELKTDESGLTKEQWANLNYNGVLSNETEFYRLVYFGGVDADLRKEVWPYLLGYYDFGSTEEERNKKNERCKHYYETTMSEWLAVDAIVQQREKEKTARAVAKLSSGSNSGNDKTQSHNFATENGELENDVFEDNSDISHGGDAEYAFDTQQAEDVDQLEHSEEGYDNEINLKAATISNVTEKTHLLVSPMPRAMKTSTDSGHVDGELDENEKILEVNVITADTDLRSCSSGSSSSYKSVASLPIRSVGTASHINEPNNIDEVRTDMADNENVEYNENNENQQILVRTSSAIDFSCTIDTISPEKTHANLQETDELNTPQARKSSCISPASSNGGVYSSELLEQFGLNLHRIEKDVQRCDRNYWYFANDNLDKLRNVISTYVWEHLDIGYMQGMCDLVAPLLVIFDDESLTYHCFCNLMKHMIENFPSGGAMDMHFANMRSLIQILDSEMYDLMDANGDYSHFYFCYRWFLLDFKRELIYDDVFATWEVIWAAKHIASGHFVLFMALALLETYRDIILSNSMDFTDVIKFFNEMAERHNVKAVLQLARSLVLQLQMIIESK